MFRHDSRHTGVATGTIESIYVGSNDLHLYSINSQTCAIKWRYRTGGAVKSSPAIQVDGSGATQLVYIGSDDGKLYAIKSDGTLQWQFAPALDPETAEAPGVIRSSPLIIASQGTANFGSDDGRVYKVIGGQEQFRYTTPSSSAGPFRSSPSFNEGLIFISSLDRSLQAVDDSDFSSAWIIRLDAPSFSSPAVDDDGSIYTVSGTGTLYSARPDDVEQWRLRLNGDVSSSPAISANGTIYATTESGYLHAVKPNGTFACTFQVLGPDGRANSGDESLGGIRSSPAISDRGYVIFGSNDGILYVIEQETCKFKTSYATKGPIISSPMLINDENRTRVVFGSGDGNLYILSLNF